MKEKIIEQIKKNDRILGKIRREFKANSDYIRSEEGKKDEELREIINKTIRLITLTKILQRALWEQYGIYYITVNAEEERP